jgi:hypothetical protein
MEFDNIYKDAKPDIIKVVLIGESPPAQIDNFFYFAPNSDLYNFTKISFQNIYGEKIKEYKNFLDFFKSKGFFLDDLCHKPINDIKNDYERERERQNNINILSCRLEEYNPTVIIGIMKKIKDHIAEAIKLSKTEPKYIYYLGYPTHSKKNIDNYIYGLENVLHTLIQERVIE